jgi:UDP-glucose 4-epimerase
VAVTGSEGFIGSHLVEALVRRGNRVGALILYNSINSWGWLDSLPANVLASVDVQLVSRTAAGSAVIAVGSYDSVYAEPPSVSTGHKRV